MKKDALKGSHLSEVNETYVEHMLLAQKYGFRMILGGLACIVHSLIPNIFTSTASKTMYAILKEIEQRKLRI